MRVVYRMVLAVLAVAALGSALPAAAQQLDTPSISIVKNSRSSITLEIEAGASGAPAGFVVEWMRKSDYDALGGSWPANEYDSRIVYCQFYGEPTWNVSTGSYVLAPGGRVQVELGDVFDETGVYASYDDELGDESSYVVRVHAEATTDQVESDRSATLEASTAPDPKNCTFTLGYWKNHSDAWPVGSLTVGCQSYTKAELISILSQPAGGNGALIIGHQLIAAMVNVASGANPSLVAALIASGDAKLCALGDKLPPFGGATMPSSNASPESPTLDDYNNGIIGPGHCGEVPATVTTWGHLKSSYR